MLSKFLCVTSQLLCVLCTGKKQNSRRDLNKAVRKDHTFTFDVVFGPDADNEAVFVSTTKDLVDVLFDGYNCSVSSHTFARPRLDLLYSFSGNFMNYPTLRQCHNVNAS